MKIIPVLDILDQTVVRGVAGERDLYQPIQSCLTSSSEPLELARALRDEFALTEFYVADLDAILQRNQNRELYDRMLGDGFTLMLDCGLRTAADAETLASREGITLVAGLETLESPHELRELVQRFGAGRVVFSLDLKRGEPLVNHSSGNAFALLHDPLEIARLSREQGVTQMILLDLAQVGMGTGTGTEELCRTLHREEPALRLITGGGISQTADLIAQEEIGAAGVLVASALHDGRIGSEVVRSLS